MSSPDALTEFRNFVDKIEARAMACDGPVTPFLEELHAASDAEKERFTTILTAIYKQGAIQPKGISPSAEDQIKHMVNRFLAWRLPKNFHPDGGVFFEPVGNKGTPYEYIRAPVGTNLLDASQATAMVRHMLEGLPPVGPLCVHCDQPSVTLLDGEYLCQSHADEWVRGEGMATAKMDEA